MKNDKSVTQELIRKLGTGCLPHGDSSPGKGFHTWKTLAHETVEQASNQHGGSNMVVQKMQSSRQICGTNIQI